VFGASALVVTAFGVMPSNAAGQAFGASVGSGTHYLTAPCGSQPDRPWVNWPTLTMVHSSTPLWCFQSAPQLTLVRVD
jgi:hypothetical protein